MHYFDNNATTPVAPEVLEAMLPWLTEYWGNASSAYGFSRPVKKALDQARERLAALIQAEPSEIVFTSCGSESNNTAIHAALCQSPNKRHVITSAVEHSANRKYVQFLERQGYEITALPVEEDGKMDLCMLHDQIREDTAIVSIMWANNETGVIFPIEEIAAICRSKDVPFHSDAVQAAGKLTIDVQSTEIAFLSLSAHKIFAPKGVGALYVRQGTPFTPFLFGGGQESGRRAGTENIAGIVGFGVAAEMALADVAEVSKVKALRDRLEERILRTIPRTSRNGTRQHRLPNTSNIAFDGVEAEALLLKLDQLGICASSGSACTTGSLEPSHVLMAMGVSRTRALCSIRFSLSHLSTDGDVDFLLDALPGVVEGLRGQTPAGSGDAVPATLNA